MRVGNHRNIPIHELARRSSKSRQFDYPGQERGEETEDCEVICRREGSECRKKKVLPLLLHVCEIDTPPDVQHQQITSG